MVYMRDRTHTYLWLRDGRAYGYFLTMDTGSITVEKVDIITEYDRDEKNKIIAERKVYRVYQDGDCWLIPEGMGWSEETEFFVWPESDADIG